MSFSRLQQPRQDVAVAYFVLRVTEDVEHVEPWGLTLPVVLPEFRRLHQLPYVVVHIVHDRASFPAVAFPELYRRSQDSRWHRRGLPPRRRPPSPLQARRRRGRTPPAGRHRTVLSVAGASRGRGGPPVGAATPRAATLPRQPRTHGAAEATRTVASAARLRLAARVINRKHRHRRRGRSARAKWPPWPDARRGSRTPVVRHRRQRPEAPPLRRGSHRSRAG